jgi:uncharacterized protein (TIGR00297 family)
MNVLITVIILAGGVTAYFTGKLTLAGSISGIIIALLVFFFTGWAAFLEMAIFFILGTAATSWKANYKLEMGITGKKEERRNMAQVLANAGTAALISIVALFIKNPCLWSAMVAAAFASATADTLSSELGTIYGKRFYNILSFKRDKRGLDGVVSLEGTLIGIVGSGIIGMIHSFACGWNDYLLILLAGTIGNLMDSVLGASLERGRVIGNDAVNFLNTLIAAVVFYLLFLL